MTRAFLFVAKLLAMMGPALTGLALTHLAMTAAPASAEPRTAAVEARVARAKAAMLGDTAAAQREAVAAEAAAAGLTDDRATRLAVASAQWLQAEAAYRLGEENAAMRPLAAAIATVRREAPESQLMGDILLTRGSIRTAAIQPAGALTDFQDAYRIFHRIDNDRSQAIALMLISGLYNDAKDSEGSLRYLKQAMADYRGDPGLMIALHNGRGIALQDLRRYGEADQQFQRALGYARTLRSPLLTVRVLGNLARNRLKAGRPDSAGIPLRQALALIASPEAASWRPQVLAIAAQAAFQRGDLTDAAQRIAQSFAGSDPSTTSLNWREPHETAYNIYRRTNRPEEAMVHLAAMKRIDDDTTRLATTTSTALMGARFDFANQELRITKLRAQELQRRIELERTRAETERTIFYGGAGAAAVVVGMLVFALVTARRSRDEVRAANDGLADSNAALSQALAAKTEFLATTSHEIRTPLNGILGMTDVMLADPSLSAAMRDRLGVVHGASVTMRALVDDILDVAKMETGNLSIEAAPFDLAATLRDASRLWEEQARAKGVGFTVRLDDCPRRVMGDVARVRQVVFNLLSNALKFTADGGITLTATQGPDGVAIAVSDTGIGIPADKLAEIFESFRQADTSTTRQFGGTGLGLTICRKLARAMDGDVTVTSVVGEGATFTVTLPLPVTEHEEAVAAAPAIGMLVIERNPIARAMWTALLGRHAGAIGFAATVDEATAILARGGVSAVLIDGATIATDADPVAAVAGIVAAAAGIPTTLLWTDRDEAAALQAGTGVTRVVVKPVAGAALLAQLFVPAEQSSVKKASLKDCSDADRLVPRAA